MRNASLKLALSSLVLLGFVACGGGSSSAPAAAPAPKATGLAYTDPTGTGWRLVKDSSSTATHLVLNVVGSTTLKSRGLGFNLKSDGNVKWGKFGDGTYVQDPGVLELGEQGLTPGDPGDPVFRNAGILKSGIFTVGVFQKDRRLPAKASDQPLFRVAIDFDAATTGKLDTGTAIALAVTKAKIIPEDVGGLDLTWETVAKSRTEAITLAVGTLKAQ